MCLKLVSTSNGFALIVDRLKVSTWLFPFCSFDVQCTEDYGVRRTALIPDDCDYDDNDDDFRVVLKKGANNAMAQCALLLVLRWSEECLVSYILVGLPAARA